MTLLDKFIISEKYMAIHCDTMDKFYILLSHLKERGIKWRNDNPIKPDEDKRLWVIQNENTGIFNIGKVYDMVYKSRGITFGNINDSTGFKVKIIEFDDLKLEPTKLETTNQNIKKLKSDIQAFFKENKLYKNCTIVATKDEIKLLSNTLEEE